MNLGKFIEKLEAIRLENGEDMQVMMADNLLVVDPVFVEKNGFGKRAVIITDQR